MVSDHDHLSPIAEQFNIPYYHLPVTAITKLEQELKIRELLISEKIDLIVLARYMQILSPALVDKITAINIHHGFLRAFKGKQPYHQAWDT